MNTTTMDLKRSQSEDDANSSLRDSGISLSDETLEEEALIEPTKKRKWRKAPKKYDCAVCDKEFKGLTDLKRHLLIHSNEKPYKCDLCEKSYRQKVNLNYHTKMVHSNEKEFICGFCKKPFAYKQRLRLHLRVHTGEKPYCCQYCTSSFARSGQLKQHLESHEEKNKWLCEICSSTFTNERSLKIHVNRHGEEPNRICQICKKAFMNSKIMQAHMIRVHSNVAQFECPICELTITTEDLQTHMKIHTPAKRFQCEHCDAAFVQKCQYKVHLRKHTGERPFQCRVCWQSFAHKSVLKLHIRKHTGEKPIKCLLCKDSYVAFSQLSHLKTHMRTIHKKDNSYACEGCKECFKVKFHLDSHIEACKKYQSLKRSDCLEVVENSDKDNELLTRLRYLIAVLIKNISTPEKLKELGFGKRLIDNVLMASLKLAKRKCFEKKKMHELDRLKLNIQSFLEWIVPEEVWLGFKKECPSVESILEKIVMMYLKQVD